MGTEIPVCPLCHTPRMPRRKGDAWFWRCQNYPTCAAPTTTNPSSTTESQDVLLKQQTQGRQRQDTIKGMPTPPGQALGQRHGKGKYVSAVRGHHQRQGRDHWNQQIGPEETGERRGETVSQQNGGGTHGAGSGAGRGRRSQEVAGRGPCGGPSSREQSNQSRIPGGTSNGGDGTDQETVRGELGTSRSVTAGQKKRLLGGIRRTETLWEIWYETIKEEEKPQSNKDVTVQCIDFCAVTTSEVHAVLRHAPADLRGGTKAIWEKWYEAILEEEKLQDIGIQCVDFCEATTSKVHAVLQHAPFDLRGGTFRQHPHVLVATVDCQHRSGKCASS